jgi:Cu2+-exporting ATPase
MNPAALALQSGPVPSPGLALGESAASDDADADSTSYAVYADGRRVGRTHLQLSGLYCAACAGIIEQALLGEPGVGAARVSYATQRAEVSWDPAATRLSSLLAAVRRAGYGAAPDAAAPARSLRRAEERGALWRLFVAVFCMMQVMMYQAPIYFAAPGTLTPDLRSLLLWAAWLLSIPVVLFSAAPLFRDALQGLRRSRISMDLPVSLGVAITFVVSSAATFDPAGAFGSEVYFDSLTMFVSFLLAGRLLALKMRNRVAATLEGAVNRGPVTVRRVEADGSTTIVAARHLRPGDRVRVLAGEAFAADGPILEGTTDVDESLLTGESLPVPKQAGDEAIAGSINRRGAVVQRADRIGADTRYEGIVALMRGALTDRPAMLRSADRVAGPFLWAVLVLAAGAAAAWAFIDPTRAVWVAVSVLIVTCPCALSLAAPAALLAAAGAMARRGVLVQRLDAIEALARVDTVCFDKTGTLTESRPHLDRIELQPAARSAGIDEAAALALAASLAGLSLHPLALALAAEAKHADATTPHEWTRSEEHPGLGLEAWSADGQRYRLGTIAWACEGRVDNIDPANTQTWLAGPEGPIACFIFSEAVRPGAQATVDALRRSGLALTLLSGDASSRVRRIAGLLDIDRAQGDASPGDKLDTVALLQSAGHRVAMVGDGINDAPVMARADVSIAIGEGADLTRTKADVVLMSGSLLDIAWARETARRAVRVVHQNIGWAIAYNATCVPVALAGWFPPWAAGLGMASSSLIVIINAMRIDRSPRSRQLAGGTAP